MVKRFLVFALALLACGGKDKPASTAGDTRSRRVVHEPCEPEGHNVVDTDSNGDGKPELRRVLDRVTGKELCRIADLNHDGKPDLYTYFNAAGQVRRREYCFDDTGVVNAVERYENGHPVVREYDMTGQHNVDTWDYFDPKAVPDPKTGRIKPIRRERDTRGDGHVNQWWTWNGDQVTITFDRDGDGKPDPDSGIVLGSAMDAGIEDAGRTEAGVEAGLVDAGVGLADAAREGGKGR
ncbi:MAG: hypothetical protein WCI05_15435 [Myxococcales bacterium]